MSKCKTPDTLYTSVIHNGGCSIVTVTTLPHTLVIDPIAMKRLKKRLHVALEGVLAETFEFRMVRASLVRSRHKYMIVKDANKPDHNM